MTIDLTKIPYKSFGCITTTIGELCLFSISARNEEELLHGTDKPIKEHEPIEFIRKLIRFTCFPKSLLIEDANKPVEPLLTSEDILSLTDDELEMIVKLYIENNEYLFKKLLLKKNGKTDQGIQVISPEIGEIEYPKEVNESFIQYLLRLYIKKEEKQKRQMEKMFSGIRSFSNGLNTSIKNTLSWGESLRKTMKSIRPPSVVTARTIEPTFPDFDYKEMARSIEENRLRPFKDISDRLDRLINASAQAAEFMIETNRIQSEIAEEIKFSGNETRNYSKWNIFLTGVVIFLTTLGIIFPAYTNFQSNKNNQINRIEDRENVNLLVENLKKIDASIINNERLRIENEGLKALVEKQEKTIAELKILIDRQGNK